MARRKQKRWTDQDVAMLRAGIAGGERPREIAARLGRLARDISNKAYNLGLTGSKFAKRDCGNPSEPATAMSEVVADNKQNCDSRQEARDCRAVCLRAAGRLRVRVGSLIALAGEFECWVRDGDPAARLAALDVAAARYDSQNDARMVLEAAEKFAAWIETGEGNPAPGEPDDYDRLESVVATTTGVSIAEIKGTSRQAKYTLPRYLLAWCARRFLGLADKEIGRRIGGRDRTTIRAAVGSLAARRGMPEIEKLLKRIATAFGGDLPPPASRPESEAKPEPAPEPAAAPKTRRPRKPGRSPADRTLTDTEKKVLRAIIRDGKGTAAMIGAHAGLEPGPTSNVLNSLRRKEYIEFTGGQIKPLRLPDGKAIAPPPAGPVEIRVIAPLPLERKAPAPAQVAAPASAPAPRPAKAKRARPSRDEAGIRVCLNCQSDFKSFGYGNRLCPKCRNRGGNDWMGGVSP